MPLAGLQLIEASAGTGKTYTITNLYIRLLLGRGCANPYPVQALLVLTFTIAATQELRHRISSRIQATRQAFLTGTDDEFLQTIIDSSEDPERDRKLLTAASQLMDEAAIFTIHAFCARVLGEQSFDAGTLFTQNMDGDRQAILQRACEDCFRQDIMTLMPVARYLALTLWPNPDRLVKLLTPLLFRGQLDLTPAYSNMEFDETTLTAKIKQVKRAWLTGKPEKIILNSNLSKSRKPLKRLAAMKQFCESTDLGLDEELWLIYSTAGLEAAMKTGSVMPRHKVFNLIDDINAELQRLGLYKNNLWHLVLTEVRARIRRTKEQQHLLTLDDLLTNLAEALEKENSSLGATLINRWPIAMIDEYQDTDDTQSRILEHIYHQRLARGKTATPPESDTRALLMIGDPKQAIYQFRGADVFTYLNARHAVTNGTHTLGVNWRSSEAMVAATNILFQKNGLFDDGDAITFSPVSAAPDHSNMALTVDGKTQTPYKIFCLGEPDAPLNTDAIRYRTMNHAAEETAQLLLGARAGKVMIDKTPLAAGNIAFLVRSHRDAAAARKALARHNIPSVYLIQESVLEQDTAEDLKLIIKAVIEPANEGSIRAALASRLMQCDAGIIDQLNHDIANRQSVLQEFQTYHDIWLKENVGAMINALIVGRKLAEKWLPQPDGDRQLTNLRHLTEVLQRGAGIAPGMYGLLAWFIREQQAGTGDIATNDERQLRLENDENLVKIVTMHSAKGLEYDVVMIPNPMFSASIGKTEPALYHTLEQGRYRVKVEVGKDAENRQAAHKEQAAEDMRLLYVALTRAKYRCYLGAPHAGKWAADSAFARLMNLEDFNPKLDQIKPRLKHYLNHDKSRDRLFEIVAVTGQGETQLDSDPNQQQLEPAPAMPAVADPWRMHSYSGWSNDSGHGLPTRPPVTGSTAPRTWQPAANSLTRQSPMAPLLVIPTMTPQRGISRPATPLPVSLFPLAPVSVLPCTPCWKMRILSTIPGTKPCASAPLSDSASGGTPGCRCSGNGSRTCCTRHCPARKSKTATRYHCAFH